MGAIKRGAETPLQTMTWSLVTSYWKNHKESWKDHQKRTQRCERINKNAEMIKERILGRNKLLQQKKN